MRGVLRGVVLSGEAAEKVEKKEEEGEMVVEGASEKESAEGGTRQPSVVEEVLRVCAEQGLEEEMLSVCKVRACLALAACDVALTLWLLSFSHTGLVRAAHRREALRRGRVLLRARRGLEADSEDRRARAGGVCRQWCVALYLARVRL